MESIDYQIHPAANLMPDATQQEYEELVADLKKNGLVEHIALYKNQILDGRTRNRACVEAGVIRKYVSVPDGTDPIAYVISKNLTRRHLTPSQRAAVALEVEAYLSREAKDRKAGSLKGNQNAAKNDGGKIATIVSKEPAEKSRETAAALVGVSPRLVQDAKAVAKEAPELVPQLKTGKVTLSEAKRQVVEKKALVAEAKLPPVVPFPGFRPGEQFRVERFEDVRAYQLWTKVKRKPERGYQLLENFKSKADAVITGTFHEDGADGDLRRTAHLATDFILKPGGIHVELIDLDRMRETPGSDISLGGGYGCWLMAMVIGDTWRPVKVSIQTTEDAPDEDFAKWESWKPTPDVIHAHSFEDGLHKLVKQFTKPGDLILDPYMGASDVGVAAVSLGRRFLGLGHDQTALDAAQRRIGAAIPKVAVPA